jgi:thymidylate kinase
MIISFSGMDCCGKGTQIARLSGVLRASGRDPVVLWSRVGYTGRFEAAKDLARLVMGRALPGRGEDRPRRDAMLGGGLVRTAWLSAAMLDMAIEYAVRVRLLAATGRDVILDRYVWDSAIDLAMAFPAIRPDRWIAWDAVAAVSPRPDHAFLLRVPLEAVRRRLDVKGERLRDPEETLIARFDAYERLAASGRLAVIDGMASVEAIAEDISLAVS